MEIIEKLPGIGEYTTRTVASFAFGLQVPVVDTKLRRVLSGFASRDLSDRETWELAEQLLSPGRAADWNRALTDYGALKEPATPSQSGQRLETFGSSSLFRIGRIVDSLRKQGRTSMAGLLEVLPDANRDEDGVRQPVRVLSEEGMVAYDPHEDAVALPE